MSLKALLIALAVVMVVLAIVHSVFSSSRPATESIKCIEQEIASYLCEAAIEEAIMRVRTGMNNAQADWYPRFRRKDLTPQIEDFQPEMVKKNLMNEVYQRQWPLSVKIEFFNQENFDDIIPLRVEKKGTLKFTATLTLSDDSKRVVEVLKDCKVVNIGPPPPLDEFAVWIWTGENQGVFPARRFNLYDEDYDQLYELGEFPEAGSVIRNSWKWTWGGKSQYNNFFPFNRYKISYYCRTWNEFKDTFKAGTGKGTFYLDGLSLIGDRKGFYLGGAVEQSGMIIARQSKMVVGPLKIPEHSVFSVVALSGEKIKINNPYYNENPFGGSLYAPVGSIVNTEDTLINGVVYAGACYHMPRVNFHDKFKHPCYHVTMSEQILVMREELE